jgi:hypothetical protein
MPAHASRFKKPKKLCFFIYVTFWQEALETEEALSRALQGIFPRPDETRGGGEEEVTGSGQVVGLALQEMTGRVLGGEGHEVLAHPKNRTDCS